MNPIESISFFKNNIRSYVVRIPSEGVPKGLIILVHGLGEHVRRYDEELKYFSLKGYTTIAADLTGHGRTEGRRGVWASMEDHYKTIDGLMDIAISDYKGMPIVLYGHSMGANISAGYVIQRKLNISGLILTGAALKTTQDLPMVLVKLVLQALSWIRNITISNGLNLKYLCSDVRVIKTYKEDPLVHNKISIGAGATILNNAVTVLRSDLQPHCPVLIMHGEDDKITLPIGSIQLFDKWNKIAKLKLWEGMMHEIQNETEKIKVWDYILTWMDTYIKFT